MCIVIRVADVCCCVEMFSQAQFNNLPNITSTKCLTGVMGTDHTCYATQCRSKYKYQNMKCVPTQMQSGLVPYDAARIGVPRCPAYYSPVQGSAESCVKNGTMQVTPEMVVSQNGIVQNTTQPLTTMRPICSGGSQIGIAGKCYSTNCGIGYVYDTLSSKCINKKNARVSKPAAITGTGICGSGYKLDTATNMCVF